MVSLLPNRGLLRTWTVAVCALLVLDGSANLLGILLNNRIPMLGYYRPALALVGLAIFYLQRLYYSRWRPLAKADIELAFSSLKTLAWYTTAPLIVLFAILAFIRAILFLPANSGQGVYDWPIVGPALSYLLMLLNPVVIIYFVFIYWHERNWLKRCRKNLGTEKKNAWRWLSFFRNRFQEQKVDQ